MNNEHCEKCGEFLDSAERIYCQKCLDADAAKHAVNGVVKVSESDLDMVKWMLAMVAK